jgi:hypothetical protein
MLVLDEPQLEAQPDDIFEQKLVRQIRVVILETHGVVVRIFREVNGKMIQIHEIIPTRRRKPLPAIPFVFHAPGPESVNVAKLPLEDMINANLDHYRLSAAQRNALNYVALPLLALAGFDLAAYGTDTAAKNTTIPQTLRSTSWDAHASYVEYSGSGIDAFEKALDRCERLMAVLGSRLLEPRKNVGETAEAIELRQSGESSVLASMGLCISESLSEVMRIMSAWGTVPTPGDALPRITLNADFNTATMTPQMLRELVAAWQAKAFSEADLVEALRRGEVLPSNAVAVVGDPEQ